MTQISSIRRSVQTTLTCAMPVIPCVSEGVPLQTILWHRPCTALLSAGALKVKHGTVPNREKSSDRAHPASRCLRSRRDHPSLYQSDVEPSVSRRRRVESKQP